MAMLHLARLSGRSDLLHLVVSVRAPADLYYANEIPGPETTVIYSRMAPTSWPRPIGRVTVDDLASVLRPDDVAYVCGSPGFADAATALLIESGVGTSAIRVERFGPSG